MRDLADVRFALRVAICRLKDQARAWWLNHNHKERT